MKKLLCGAISAVCATSLWAQSEQLEEVVVTATPLNRDALEMTQATAVLSGDDLLRSLDNSIGETIERIPGVQSAFFGPGVGRPIIRGLEGARVSVLENNIATNDVSSLSADHAVTVEPFLAEQVEVLKGPATLLYGSNGIGGVVNVRTNRVPSRLTDGVEGAVQLQGDSVSDARFGAASLNYGEGSLGLHADIFYRDREDYDIPGFAEEEPDADEEAVEGILENSFVETSGGSLGLSYLFDGGHAGIAFSRYDNKYGIPGAGHHHEEEDDHGEEEDDHEHEGEEEEELVSIDIEQEKVDLNTEIASPFAGFDRLRAFASFNDYQHTEFEGNEVGTQFDTDTFEGRLELLHEPVWGWNGVVGVQYYDRDFSAVGEEAFVPPSETERIGLFLLEEQEFGDVLVELGVRIDDVDTDSVTGVSRSFSPFSASAGMVWHLSDSVHLSGSLSSSERAPVEEELFSDGPHIATQTFEVGDADLDEETSTNAEITLRKHAGAWTGSVTLYRNDFDDFIYLADTGMEEDELPVRVWSQQDADFTGLEAELRYAFTDSLEMYLMGDTVDAELDDGSNVPRTPPQRFGGGIDWDMERWAVGFDVIRYSSQDDIAAFEDSTDGYTLVGADFAYRFNTDTRWEIYLRGRNLGDEEARNHTSLLKEGAPLPGRNFIFGIRAQF